MIIKIKDQATPGAIKETLERLLSKLDYYFVWNALPSDLYSRVIHEEDEFEEIINKLQDISDSITNINPPTEKDLHLKQQIQNLLNEYSRSQKPTKPNLDILKTKEWSDFDTQFEENFEGNPKVYRLLNHDHHKEVAALAAQNLSTLYKSIDEVISNHNIMQKAYNEAAKLLYPEERLVSGTEYHTEGGVGPQGQSHIPKP